MGTTYYNVVPVLRLRQGLSRVVKFITQANQNKYYMLNFYIIKCAKSMELDKIGIGK